MPISLEAAETPDEASAETSASNTCMRFGGKAAFWIFRVVDELHLAVKF